MELLLQLIFKKLLHTAIEINMYSFLPYQGLHFILFLSKELILQLVKKNKFSLMDNRKKTLHSKHKFIFPYRGLESRS